MKVLHFAHQYTQPIAFTNIKQNSYVRLNHNDFSYMIIQDSSCCKQHWQTTLLYVFCFFPPLLALRSTRIYQLNSWLLKWLTSREKALCHKEHQQALHFWVLGLSPFVPHCSFSHSYSPGTQLKVTMLLCFSLSAWIPPPLSLFLSILGFTVSIPEGRSIDCNSLSMKSPLCYWRKETSFNRTDNSLPLFLLIAPSLPFYIYNLLSSLFCV